MPDNWIVGRSDTGWMKSDTFFEYIANGLHVWLEEKQIKRPILLFVDGHKSHLSMALSDFCSSNNIILYALPPNTTHIMQPADVGAFKGLKSDFQKTVRSWQSLPENLGKAVTKFNFCTILETVLYEKDRTEIIKNSFRKCGLYPFNPNAVDYSKYVQDILERNTELGSASQGPRFTKNDFECAKAVISSLKLKLIERDINYETLMDIIEKEEIDLKENWPETPIDPFSSSNIEGTYLIDNVGTLIKVSSTISDSASEINNNDNNLGEPVKLNDPILCLSLDPDNSLTLDTGDDVNGILNTATNTSTNGEANIIIEAEESNCSSKEAVNLNDSVPSMILDPETTLTLDTGADANDEIPKNVTNSSTVILNEDEADIIVHAGESNSSSKENRTVEVNIPILQKSPAQLSPLNPKKKHLVSSNFAKHLFYPEPFKSEQPRKTKEKPPMSVSSIAWKQFFKRKEELEVEKRKQIEKNKEERLKKRMERAYKIQNRKPRLRKTVLRKPEVKCPECEVEVLTDVEDDGLKNIGCDNCDNWFHLKCTHLSSLTINEAEHKHFVCKFCPSTSSYHV